MRRDHWQRRIAELDPDVDFHEIYRILGGHEFPWDLRQSLGLALYRTYAVPSIGELLSRTREFEERTHKRYADTALLLDAIAEHGFAHPDGRGAIRRMNQMHGRHAISDDDMRYVLSTFVVVPTRWIERFGWRPLSEAERAASTNYYRELGRHMNIKAAPTTYEGFAALLDAYEAEHFAFSPGGRAVADATLNLLAGFHPFPRLLRAISMALLDDPLRAAFRYPPPTAFAKALAVGGLRARAALIRRLPHAGTRSSCASCVSSTSTRAATASRISAPGEFSGASPGTRRLMLRRSLLVSTIAAFALVTADANAASVHFDLKAKGSETKGRARAVGTLKVPHGRNYAKRRAVVSGRLNDVCPADGYGAYLEVRVYFTKPGSDLIYASKRVEDVRTCKAKAKRFTMRTGLVKNAYKVTLQLYEYDVETGDIAFNDQALAEYPISRFDDR